MATSPAPTPELALYLQDWLKVWPREARGLWHDLAQGRLPTTVYRQPEGRRFAGGAWPAWCYVPNGVIAYWMARRGDRKLPFFQDLTERHDGYLKGDQMGFVPMLGACYRVSLAGMAAAEVQADWHDLRPFLSVLLYLYSANREIHDPQGRDFQPTEPKLIVSGKQGLKAFAAEKISTWAVAWRIGAALDAAERREREASGERLPSAPTGAPRKPPLRRAHWHLFWTGKGRAEPKVHWLPPIPVNVAARHEPTVVVHPVGTGDHRPPGKRGE